MTLASAADIRRDVAQLFRPPVRMSVSEAGTKFVKVRTASGGVAPWDASLVPYMIEPMNALTDRAYEAIIFVGPAQSGKTQALVDCWIGHNVCCDPSDMMVMQTSGDTARDYAKRRVNRMHRTSPDIGKELASGGQNDNIYDKVYKAGNILSIGWPSINQLSGRSIKKMALTDYDRMPQDVDKEGSPFHLGAKRTTTFLSRGTTLVETSPGFEVQDPKWTPRESAAHEAPPTKGALSLFNLGDRRRRYWPCPHCGDYFMQSPGIEGFTFKHDVDLFGVTDPQIIGPFGVTCTSCGTMIDESHKQAMNAAGLWVPEGCEIVKGKVVGERRRTKIASFWLPGAMAAYQSWESLIQAHLNALREYDITGTEESLKTTTNVDFGAPYLPRRMMSDLGVKDIESRAEDVVKRAVMPGVRFITAEVDVQKNHFVVQVVGRGMGDERWIVDRFEIRNSKRKDNGEYQPVDPAAYEEDWGLITEQVINRSYPLADDSGRVMQVMAVACDSGGRAGVTERAYKFWMKLKRRGLHRKFFLVKGERPGPHARKPRVSKSFPDNSSRSARRANARGEIPIWILNSTLLKDTVNADLKRAERGPRYIHFPDWLKSWFYEELVSEVRSEKGWENPARAHNEAFDLLYYEEGLMLAWLSEKRIQEIDWSKPPTWAAEWDENILVGIAGEKSSEKPARKTSLADLAQKING